MDPLFPTTLLLGLIGSLHCAGMCGGIGIGLQSGGIKDQTDRQPGAWLRSLMINLGRITTYVLAGGIAASLGFTVFQALGTNIAGQIMQFLVGAFLILVGIYLSGLWNGIWWLEKPAQFIWQKLSPYLRRVLPLDSAAKQFLAGMIWGWLPCGLMFSALILTLTAGSFTTGMSAMLMFGLGTLPMMMGIGLLGQFSLNKFGPMLRKIAAGLLIVFGSLIFTGVTMSHGITFGCNINQGI